MLLPKMPIFPEDGYLAIFGMRVQVVFPVEFTMRHDVQLGENADSPGSDTIGLESFATGDQETLRRKPAHGSFLCCVSREKMVFRLKAAGSSLAVSSRHSSGVDTVAPGTARST